MNGYKRIAWLLGLGLASLAGFSQAASFDCNKASTQVEKLICSTADLSDADSHMASTYRAVRAERADVLDQQRAWLRNTRNPCKNVACLREVYATRIEELEFQKNTPEVAQALSGPEFVAKKSMEPPNDALAAMANIPTIMKQEWPSLSANDRHIACLQMPNMMMQIADLRVEYAFASEYEKSIMDTELGLNAKYLEHLLDEWTSFNSFLVDACN